MRITKAVVVVAVASAAIGLLTSTEAEAKKKKQQTLSGFLGDYSDLEPSADTKDLLVYRKSEGVLKGYREFILDQPLVYFHSEAKEEGIDPNDLKMLSDFLRDRLVEALEEGGAYRVVEEAGEGVAHARIAITDVVPVDPKKNTGTKVAGMALGVGLLVPRVDMGRASIEAEILDSLSGERLVAVVATKEPRRMGGVIKGSKEWGDVKTAFKKWATSFRRKLDQAHSD